MEKTIKLANSLQKQLHQIPEISGCETQTKKSLKAFMEKESELEIVDCGAWFYAAHREADAAEGMALRADMDAVTGADSLPYHGCGHDGHSAVMAALAAYTSGKRFGKNLFFLFQHAEETGAGAEECCGIFEKEKIDAIYGFHNCPGFPEGDVLLLHDTFACASRGVRLMFEGSQAHAAYPENGRNPIFPMAAFFDRWQEMTDPAEYGGMVLATPVCLSAGSRSFGVAAGSGEIDLTLRAWRDEDLEKLEAAVTETAAVLASDEGVSLSYTEQDVFPATAQRSIRPPSPRTPITCTSATTTRSTGRATMSRPRPEAYRSCPTCPPASFPDPATSKSTDSSTPAPKRTSVRPASASSS